jgi:hypothetical protein
MHLIEGLHNLSNRRSTYSYGYDIQTAAEAVLQRVIACSASPMQNELLKL